MNGPMAPSIERPSKPRKLSALRALRPFLAPYRGRVGLALLLLCLASGILLTLPLTFRDLIDKGFLGQISENKAEAALPWRFLLLFAIGLFWAMAAGGRHYLVTWLGERVTADLRSAVYTRVLRQSPQFFETLQTGEVLARLTGDTTLVQTVVGSSISMGLRSAVQAMGGMAMLALTSFKLFAINLGLLGCLMLPLIALGRRVRRLSRESQDRLADASAVAGEVLNAAPTVQAYTQEVNESRRYTGLVETGFKTAMRRAYWRSIPSVQIIVAVFGAILFVLWLGARYVMEGEMTAGQLTSFVLYAVIVAGAVSTLAEVWGDVMRAAGATERLMELLHARSPIQAPLDPVQLPEPRAARITFDAVTFRYPSRPQQAALEGFTLDILPGETIALVGPSGAGKTTVFQLIQRFYDAGQGRVLFNDSDVRSLALSELRGAIAIVPQDAVIFSTNALENIRYGRSSARDDEVIAAAKSAHADEFIVRLPEAYHTFLGERGVRLSGGQRQRIAIARAILKNAPLLLLDEATSALDAESEKWVQSGLETAMQGRTTLIIAHRLATVQRADRLIVMEHGRIVEMGTPDELRQSGGLYARLAELQLAA